MNRQKTGKIFDLHVDAYSPSEMAKRVEDIGVAKARLAFWPTFVLSLLAGVFIGFGAEFYTFVVHDAALALGLTQLLGGAVFTLGLILVVVAGAELFTGNTLIIMALMQQKISLKELLRNWGIVYFGNLVGSLAIVALIILSRQFVINNELVGAKALLIANSKVNYSFTVAFTRGILCNILVTLAVWLSIAGRHVIDKIAAIFLPITAFVASGFEHSVANMYFIPMGLILKSNPGIIRTAQETSVVPLDLSSLTLSGFIVNNLIPVTLGNIVGGVVFVGLAYWFVFLRPPLVTKVKEVSKHRLENRKKSGITLERHLDDLVLDVKEALLKLKKIKNR